MLTIRRKRSKLSLPNTAAIVTPAGGTDANFDAGDDADTAVADAFLSWVDGFGVLQVTCDPTNLKTYPSPLPFKAAADHLAKQVDSAVAEGVFAWTGGGNVSDDSAFFQSTVLTGVPTMFVFKQELFGPFAKKVIRTAD